MLLNCVLLYLYHNPFFMNNFISPVELEEIGLHFYRFVEHHIDQLERDYLLGTHELPFVHYCFRLFVDHYRTIHTVENNKN